MPAPTPPSPAPQRAPRTVVVTGAATGLGQAVAAALLDDPGTTVVAPTRRRPHQVLAGMAGHPGSARLRPVQCDLAQLAATRRTAAGLAEQLAAGDLPPLAGIVCAAAVQPAHRTGATVDGLEPAFAVAVAAHHALLTELMPLLPADAPLALVTDGLGGADLRTRLGLLPVPRDGDLASWSRPGDAHDPAAARRRAGLQAYADSRLAVARLAQAWAAPGPTSAPARTPLVHVVDPGWLPGTPLTREAGAVERWLRRAAAGLPTAGARAHGTVGAGLLLAQTLLAAPAPRPDTDIGTGTDVGSATTPHAAHPDGRGCAFLLRGVPVTAPSGWVDPAAAHALRADLDRLLAHIG